MSDNSQSMSSGPSTGPVYYTPLAGLRILLEQGHVFDIEVREFQDDSHPEFRERRWRADIWESRKGVTKGSGEAQRKTLAKHAAMLDLIANFNGLTTEELPRCKIPIGARISPRIIVFLDELCAIEKKLLPTYCEDVISINGREMVEVTVHVDEVSFSAHSSERKWARFHAAYKAYNAMSKERFPLDDAFTGTDCLEDLSQFELVETEQTHIVRAQLVNSAVAAAPRPRKRTHARSVGNGNAPMLKRIQRTITNTSSSNEDDDASQGEQSKSLKPSSWSDCGFFKTPQQVAPMNLMVNSGAKENGFESENENGVQNGVTFSI